MKELKVLELYSGIGGMHCALKECGILHEVVAAVDINNVANDIYKLNFPKTKLLQRAIESLSLKELNKLQMDMVTMSPPCQPFTRVGLQKDAGDQRTKSFFHVLDLLPKLNKQPKYILLENVKGFDTSITRDVLLETLRETGYHIQEFLVTPLQFGVPNSRLRYYLLAKRQDLSFEFPMSEQIHTTLPDCIEPYLHHKVRNPEADPSEDDGRWDLSSFCTCVDQTSSGEICASCMKLRYISKKANATSGFDNGAAALHKSTIEEMTGSKSSRDGSADSVMTDASSDVRTGHSASPRLNDLPDKYKLLDSNGGGAEDCSSNTEHATTDLVPNCDKVMRNNMSAAAIAYVKYRSICRPVSDYLEDQPEDYFKYYLIPEKYFRRFWVMDIIKPHARNSCCFTKRYAHHLEGSGSVIQMATDNNIDLRAYKIERQYNDIVEEGVRSLKLRYFTPREIANIMCFPPWFEFPEELSLIQKYRVLGNSLNVHVVAILMRLLIFGENDCPDG